MSANFLVETISSEGRLNASTAVLGGLAGGLAVRSWFQARRIRQLEHELKHDALTGLLTKDAIRKEVDARLEAGLPTGLAILDMDAFKKVNDTLGHSAGDQLLSSFGVHLRNNFRRSTDRLAHEKFYTPQITNDVDAVMGRNGGDEFVVVFDLSPRDENDERQTEEIMTDSALYLRNVVNKFEYQQPAQIQAVGFGLSLGTAFSTPDCPLSASDLYSLSDAELYLDKEARGGAR